ncbi:MAG TPA: LytR C-terminal domain-containing protein [Solirubrobacterales bacterium]|nr:LytR C-terminal domain-containing protein [Solirubrobacterales bacterium]
MSLLKEIGAFAGLVAFLGLALLAMLSFSQARDLRRLREWAGSAPERDTERKDAASATAAQRAEEMRKLEEAREEERKAAAQREERRARREAGLPEATWLERARERFADPRWLAALFAVVLVVVGGVAYAALHGFGGGASAGDAVHGGALKRGDIEVTVLNGTAVPGLAQHYGDLVERRGFKLGVVTNSTASFAASVVMYRRGHAPEARRVGRALRISKLQLMTQEVSSVSSGAPVSVIVGEDSASATG